MIVHIKSLMFMAFHENQVADAWTPSNRCIAAADSFLHL